jgi:phosphatidylserine/phosphatidylglycerophosphate/cardiolipin synthase-like enzyme
VLIVDDEVLSIGTANMDLRSFNHNFEVTAMIYDRATVAEALTHFEAISVSARSGPYHYRRRNIFSRTMESVCRLFSPCSKRSGGSMRSLVCLPFSADINAAALNEISDPTC